MADNRKLAAGLMALTPSARQDLAQREEDMQRGKTVELLRRAGKEMYENPIVNTAIGLSPVLGDIQAGVEAYRSAQAGDWGNAGLNAAGMLPFIPMLGKTVWHGSPHSFEKFDLSRMGTGEGNQAFGPGLYLAESPGVAQSYQFIDAAIDPNAVKYGGKKLETLYNNAQRAQEIAHRMPNSPAKNQAIDQANAELGFWEDLMTRNHPKQVIDRINDPDYGWETQAKFANSLDLNKFAGVDMNPGNLYKVDLPDEQIAKMIDWDLPLSEQSQAIQDFARNADISGTTNKTKTIIEAWREGRDVGLPAKGEHLINAVTNWGDKGIGASKQMLEQGIPGVKYLDAMSRDGSNGTRNYVVFSDEIPQILERNNQVIK